MKLFLALEIITQVVFSGVAPFEVLSSGKKRKHGLISTFLNGGWNSSDASLKSVEAAITKKDIFSLLFSKGWERTKTVADVDDDDDDSEDELLGFKKKEKEYHVQCDKCDHITYSASKTQYTNAGTHANSCYGKVILSKALGT